jgi:hypothetical protein
MKVISFVPSLTETLIEAGVNVVGRTRFCIHPANQVKNIPVVGGTKDASWDKVKSLQADILVFDQEENPRSFAEEAPIPFVATHIVDVKSCAENLRKLASSLQAPRLREFADRFENLKSQDADLNNFVDWIQAPKGENKIEYIIWRNPMMAVSQNTFIGSVFELLNRSLPLHLSKYPKLSDEFQNEFKKDTIYLFSSEPYPFAKHREWISSLGVAAGLVDGESFSWFGIRSLKFLEGLSGKGEL